MGKLKKTSEGDFKNIDELFDELDRNRELNFKPSGMAVSQTTSFKKICIHTKNPIFTISGVGYYGSKEYDATKYYYDASWLVVSLLGKPMPVYKDVLIGNPESIMTALKPHVFTKMAENYISINWPDMGTPPVHLEFWETLQAAVKQANINKVLFYCMGGHGRTGTALALTYVTGMAISAQAAIHHIRKEYCDSAIETQAQEDYIKAYVKYLDAKEATLNKK